MVDTRQEEGGVLNQLSAFLESHPFEDIGMAAMAFCPSATPSLHPSMGTQTLTSRPVAFHLELVLPTWQSDTQPGLPFRVIAAPREKEGKRRRDYIRERSVFKAEKVTFSLMQVRKGDLKGGRTKPGSNLGSGYRNMAVIYPSTASGTPTLAAAVTSGGPKERVLKRNVAERALEL